MIIQYPFLFDLISRKHHFYSTFCSLAIPHFITTPCHTLTTCHHLPPLATTWHHLPPLDTAWHHLPPLDTTWHHLPPLATTCHHSSHQSPYTTPMHITDVVQSTHHNYSATMIWPRVYSPQYCMPRVPLVIHVALWSVLGWQTVVNLRSDNLKRGCPSCCTQREMIDISTGRV